SAYPSFTCCKPADCTNSPLTGHPSNGRESINGTSIDWTARTGGSNRDIHRLEELGDRRPDRLMAVPNLLARKPGLEPGHPSIGRVGGRRPDRLMAVPNLLARKPAHANSLDVSWPG